MKTFKEQSRDATISNEDLSRISDEDLAQKLSPYFPDEVLQTIVAKKGELYFLLVQKAFKSLKKPISDKPLIYELLKVDPGFLRFVDEKLIEDKEFISKITEEELISGEKKPVFYDPDFVPDSFKEDPEFVRQHVIPGNIAYLENIGESLKTDKYFILSIVTEYESALRYVTESLIGDKDIVLAAVSKDDSALVHASEELKKDPDVIEKAIEKNENALVYIHTELKRSREFCEQMIYKLGGQVLGNFSVEFLQDPKMVKIAMQEVATRHKKKGYDKKLLECQKRFLQYSENDPNGIYGPHKDMLEKACEDHIKQMIQQGITPSPSPTPDQKFWQPSTKEDYYYLES